MLGPGATAGTTAEWAGPAAIQLRDPALPGRRIGAAIQVRLVARLGAPSPPPGLSASGQSANYGLALEDDDANAFFTTAESLAQLQLSEPSSQCTDRDRSAGRFAGIGTEFLGVRTSGGPTG